LILCDALHYAVQQKCGIIIDIATLTGVDGGFGQIKQACSATMRNMIKITNRL
jgi:leucyl aminopeptidase